MLVVVGVPALAFLAWSAPGSSLFAVRDVHVTGASVLSDAFVRSRVQDQLDDRTIFNVDTALIERRIDRLPFVSGVTVDRHFPQGLEIHVREFQPIALGIAKQGSWLIAPDGTVLVKARISDWQDRIPTVNLNLTTLKPGEYVGDEPALRLLRATPSNFPGTFTQVEFVEEGFVGVLDDGVEIRFGSAEGLGRKLQVAERLLTMIPPAKLRLLDYVDVSVPARPAVHY